MFKTNIVIENKILILILFCFEFPIAVFMFSFFNLKLACSFYFFSIVTKYCIYLYFCVYKTKLEFYQLLKF